MPTQPMLLSLYEFNQLSQRDRTLFACLKCEFVLSRVEDDRVGLLYHCSAEHCQEAYFIEVWYSVLHRQVDEVATFQINQPILPYLDFIDIADLWR